jgi:hypothetical protein
MNSEPGNRYAATVIGFRKVGLGLPQILQRYPTYEGRRRGNATKNVVLWEVTPCGCCMNRRFGETKPSIIRVTRIGELGATLALTSN